MLKIEEVVLVIVDVQGKLAQLMQEKEQLFENLRRMIQGIKALGAPIIWAEHLPTKMGPTTPEVAEVLDGLHPIVKKTFSCCDCEEFILTLRGLKRRQALLAGIETHICVYQTVMDLTTLGYEVQVVSDAVSSRTAVNKQIGLERCKQVGAGLTGTETALFELLRVAEGAKFKEILQIIK